MISRFGTNKDMIIQPIVENDLELLIAIDSKGLYITQPTYLNRNIADPNRAYCRKTIDKRLQNLGIDAKEMFETNKHLIQALPKETAVKVNPLKASKRSMKK